MIRIQLKTTYRLQTSYADYRKRDLEFEEGDTMYLKISPIKGVVRFGKQGKLNPRYVDPYEIVKRVGKVAYELRLSGELPSIHLVFYVSILRKCIGDPKSILSIKGLGVENNFSYEEVPVEILDR